MLLELQGTGLISIQRSTEPVLVHFPRMLILDLATNIARVAQQLQLDVVIHLALEFAIRRHLTVEISGSAHLHPRVPRVPRPYRSSILRIPI